MRLLSLFLFVLPCFGQSISFINPGPGGENSQYANNPSFALGSSLDIQWTPSNQSLSLVLYQQTESAVFEYIFQNQVGLSSYNWVVSTSKDLSVSRIFFFEIFITGETGPTASSHYFNITGDTHSSSSSSTTVASTVTSSAASSSSAVINSASTTAASAPSSTGGQTSVPTAAATAGSSTVLTQSSSGGMSTGAKIGLGIGISLGVIGIVALAIAGMLLKRRRKDGNNFPFHSTYHEAKAEPVNELPARSFTDIAPVELPNNHRT